MFRLSDFYKTFNDDAKTVSELCNIVVTVREREAREGRDMAKGVNEEKLRLSERGIGVFMPVFLPHSHGLGQLV